VDGKGGSQKPSTLWTLKRGIAEADPLSDHEKKSSEWERRGGSNHPPLYLEH